MFKTFFKLVFCVGFLALVIEGKVNFANPLIFSSMILSLAILAASDQDSK